MSSSLLQQLTAATSDAEREAIVLEMSLSGLSVEMKTAVYAAAIPHTFNALLLDALLGDDSDDLYEQLVTLSFVQQVRGKGYAIHNRTRQQLLQTLWRDNPDQFRVWSAAAAAYAAAQASHGDAPHWEAEAIYHQLVSEPDKGLAGLQALATRWANYEHHSYDEIERAVGLADEQIAAGRLGGTAADWTRLWQAKLALLYNQPDRAAAPLATIGAADNADPLLAAELAQTRGDWLWQQGEQTAAAASWQAAYAAYQALPNGQGRLDAFLVGEKLRQQGLTAPETEADPPATTPRRDRTDLLLMDNIETAWINGVLKTALRQTIDLRLTRDGGQPANLVYHRPQGLDRPLINGGGGRLSRLFAAADGSLLILGAPGSGKTITLLQLLDELLQQARADHTAPIPLLFNLSSFANFRHADKGDFVDWLADQAYHQYRLKRETTRQRLASSDFVLLLDGLDEVANADGQREACVAAINTFRQTAPCGLVVCSRITDYRPLHQRLESLHTLLLQPLGNGQIDGFLAALDSPQRQAMQQRVADDWRLREVLRSPLLLNLYPQVFAALGDDHRLVQSPRLDQSAESVEDHRQQLFAAYVETVFADSPRPSERVEEVPTETVGTSGQSLRWLTFLASRMQQVGSSVFFIEELQPTWLPERLNGRYRVGYGALLGLIFGLIQGLSAGLIVGFFGLNGLFHGLDQGWRVGLSSSICGAIATWLTTKVQRSWLQTIAGGVIFFGLVSLMNFGLIGVVNYGLGMTVSIGIASCTSIIQLREKVQFLRPSMARIQHYGKQGVGYGLIFGLISGLISGALDNLRSIPRGSLSEGLSVGLSIGLTIGLGAFLLAFLDNPLVDKQPLSRNGIRTSLRNALLMTLLTALLFGFPSWFIDQWLRAYSFIISIVIDNLLPFTFTWFGGLAWCQHWALRRLLRRQGWLPWRLAAWLDDMVARGLLRRVGGGYIFIHRSLLDYFANLDSAKLGVDKGSLFKHNHH